MNALRLLLKLACVSLMLANVLRADSFDQGIDAYHASEYAEAIQHLEASLQSAENPAARHNLALCYFQTGRLGEATWQLEQATRLAPLNASYQFKLRTLRQELGLYESPARWWQMGSSFLSASTWALLLAGCFWLSLALFLIPSAHGKSRSLVFKLAKALCVTGLLLSITALTIRQRTLPSGLVIADEAVTLRHAPAAAAPEAGVARPGERLMISETYADFVKVETEAEIVGWLPADTFRPL